MPIKESPLGTEYDPSEDTIDDQQAQAESAEGQDEDAEASAD